MKTPLKDLIRTLVLQELNTTSAGGASSQPGAGEHYSTPKSFKEKTESAKALKISKELGFKKISRPKRPSNTKLFDFL